MHNIDISEFDIKNEVSEKYKEKKVRTAISNIIIVVGSLACILWILGLFYWSILIFSLGFVLGLIVMIAEAICEYYDRNYFKHKIYFYYTNNQLLSFYKEYNYLYFKFSDNGLVKEKFLPCSKTEIRTDIDKPTIIFTDDEIVLQNPYERKK